MMTNRFMPTGGVIRPSSTATTMMMPNQIGSKPKCTITGNTIGTSRIIIAIDSSTQPSRMKKLRISASVPIGPRPRLTSKSATFCGVWVTVRK
ncbi:hypothetical protein D3C81_2084240 [compost metagenome]